jgi:hypothetical protein
MIDSKFVNEIAQFQLNDMKIDFQLLKGKNKLNKKKR